MTQRYMAELAPVPRLVTDEQPPAGTKLWLMTRHGTGYAGHYDSRDASVVAWCPLPKFTPEQKAHLRQGGPT